MDNNRPLFGGQVRLLLTEFVGNKVAVLDADCDPDALERCRSGTLMCACPREFDSVREFESHYASRHRLTCAQCRAAMPTERLLELHIAESHDPIFAARPKYECVVEGCPEHFASWADRKKHAVDAHRYPAGFAYFPHAPLPNKHQVRPSQHSGVPRRICFGRGSPVAWHRQRPPSTSRVAQDIDMKDIADALDT
uniref:Alpha-snap protein n=1 Tax=Rhipicephalus zambeziensis TaxID=60191 RepID=A0A224YJD7_9ACAR